MDISSGAVTSDVATVPSGPANGASGSRPPVNSKSADVVAGGGGLPREDLPVGADGLTGTHQVIHLDAEKWGFGKQTVVVVSFREELPLLRERFPEAAFWSYLAWWRFVLLLGEEEGRTPEDNAHLLAQLNCLKITFGGTGASVMMTDDDVRRWMTRSGMRIPEKGDLWTQPAAREWAGGLTSGKA